MKYKNKYTGIVKTRNEWIMNISYDEFWGHDPISHFEEMVESGVLVAVEGEK